MLPALEKFHTTRKRHPGCGIGLMSGTSLDGIDAALVEIGDFDGYPIQLHHHIETEIPSDLRQRLLCAMSPSQSSVEEICQLNFEMAEHYSNAVIQLCQSAGRELNTVDWIGSHGQTVYHIPEADASRGLRTASTLQLGDPSVIAEKTGITTIGNFRARDMAVGGVGAPLIPFVDAVLFANDEEDRICQNIGGIANCTLLGRDETVLAFDSGPGNMVMNLLMQRHTDFHYDKDGETAAQGRVNESLLQEALKHPYFAKSPPKATGHEDFGEQFVDWFESQQPDLSFTDHMATALELTTQSMVQAYRNHLSDFSPKEVIVSGGGAKNPVLMNRLKDLAPELRWSVIDEYGIPSEAKEAVGFALLGYATLHGIPANVPSVTRAEKEVVLGCIAYG